MAPIHEPGARWHRHRIPTRLATVIGRTMRSQVGRYLAPHLRGRITPRILDALERDGWHVHRIGAAAYVHAPGDAHHLIFGVWARREPAPSWADRLGQVSDGYRRRVARATFEQRWRRLARDEGGRFAFLLPWHRWPTPAVYRFEPSQPGWFDAEAAAIAAHNRRIREDRGLAAASVYTSDLADWTESEARAAWGDR